MVSSDTQKFSFERNTSAQIKQILKLVYSALSEKGYNPYTQIIGYILSGDPTYITGHNGARAQIGKLERDELLEELVRDYLDRV
jgi:uncharacterized protein (UPF0297 family)